MNDIIKNLSSALFKLKSLFAYDAAEFHFAVAIAFSAILRQRGFRVVVVGGQAAVYWTRLVASVDVDFVCEQESELRVILERIGFKPFESSSFRFLQPDVDAMIELMGDKIEIANNEIDLTEMVYPEMIDHIYLQQIMPGPAEVLNPVLVFLNYADAAMVSSKWHDPKDDGSLARERALALYQLMPNYIDTKLKDVSEQIVLRPDLLEFINRKIRV